MTDWRVSEVTLGVKFYVLKLESPPGVPACFGIPIRVLLALCIKIDDLRNMEEIVAEIHQNLIF